MFEMKDMCVCFLSHLERFNMLSEKDAPYETVFSCRSQ